MKSSALDIAAKYIETYKLVVPPKGCVPPDDWVPPIDELPPEVSALDSKSAVKWDTAQPEASVPSKTKELPTSRVIRHSYTFELPGHPWRDRCTDT